MSIFVGAGYILALAALNHIRGGWFNKFFQATVFWKLAAAAGVGLFSWLLLPLGTAGLALGALWYAFMLPPWASWFDMGLLPADLDRKNSVFNAPYHWLSERIANQREVDVAMMTLRGLLSVVIFAPLALYQHTPMVVLITLPCALLWMLGYLVDRWFIKENWSEYLSGAAVAACIVWAVQ